MRPIQLAGTLALAGLIAGGTLEPASATRLPAAAPAVEHKVYGTVQSLHGSMLVIRMRSGHLLTVDGRLAHSSVLLTRNRSVIVYGTVDAGGAMHANAVWRTFPDAAHWPADR